MHCIFHLESFLTKQKLSEPDMVTQTMIFITNDLLQTSSTATNRSTACFCVSAAQQNTYVIPETHPERLTDKVTIITAKVGWFHQAISDKLNEMEKWLRRNPSNAATTNHPHYPSICLSHVCLALRALPFYCDSWAEGEAEGSQVSVFVVVLTAFRNMRGDS